MRGGANRVLLPVLAVAAFILALGASAAADRRQVVAGPATEEPVAIPLLSAPRLSMLAGGFGPAMADIYWIRVISAGEENLQDSAGQWRMFGLLDRVTALDPHFSTAYDYGSLLLSIVGGRPDLADFLLVRGELTFPGQWQYPFYRGFNRLYHDLNFSAAALHLSRAAAIPGAPPLLKPLARRLRMQQYDPRIALELIARLERGVNDPALLPRLRLRHSQITMQLKESGR
ncbi:MAG: hypothetical protein OEW11_10220 [Nitrospirota bacterium]|nr:hypothetical protein [Nitrospirota bacterium]